MLVILRLELKKNNISDHISALNV